MARTKTEKPAEKAQDEPPPRRGRAASVAGDVSQASRAAFVRAGFTDPSLVLRWTEIAGPQIARIARPLRFAESAAGGVLTLLAEPGAALFLSHDSRALAARINSYLGRDAVARVKFVQGSLTLAPPLPHPPKPGPKAKAGDPVHNYQGPEGLKNALESLARWRRPADKPAGKH